MKLQLALVTLCLAAAAASAEDKPADRAFKPTVTNGEKLSEMVVEGSAPDLPDGTILHVTLSVAGNFPTPIEAAFFQVKVEGGKYSGRCKWEGKSLAPLVYWAKSDLLMSKQTQAIREHLRKLHGWGFDHREQIGVHTVTVGTPEEGTKFRKETLQRLREFVVKTQALRDKAAKVVEQPAKGNAGWAEAEKGFYGELRACMSELKAFLDPRVVWHEQRLIEDVKSAHNELTRAIQGHGKGQDGAPTVARVGDALTVLLANVDGRLPTGDMPFPMPSAGPK